MTEPSRAPARLPFITFEGGEGAGKSTQIALLGDRLVNAGYKTVRTREPGGSASAEDIRNLLVTGEADRWTPMSECLLHFAARVDHVEKVIKPALKRGEWVLCDRFADSTRAYQGYAQGLGIETVERIYRLTIGKFAPGLTLILDIPVEVGLERAHARETDNGSAAETRYEKLGLDFHKRLREAFRTIATKNSGRCHIVDATGSPEDVAQRIADIVSSRYGLSL